MSYILKTLKVCIPAILIVIGLLNASFSMDAKMEQGLSEDSKMLYGFINREGKKLAIKYHMIQSGIGIGGMDKVWLMQLTFDRHNSLLNEEEARKLIVNCVNDFLEAVNNEKELKPFLENYPFIAKNLKVSIHNWDHGHYAIEPYIITVSESKGEVGYFTIEDQDSMQYKSEKYESFEEAVAILKKASS